MLPVDLGEWVPEDDISRFIVEAVERVKLGRFHLNENGGGSKQYHPRMMLALLIYCYVNGIFTSRKIEEATYMNIGCRFVAANQHPDHDTVAKFRRENKEAIEGCFLEVLLMAKEMGLLKVGTVSVDGTKIKANASRKKSLRYDRAKELVGKIRKEISELMAEAEESEGKETEDGNKIPEEIARLDTLKAKLDAAVERLEKEAREKAEREQKEYEEKVRRREKSGRGGRPIKEPRDTPEDKKQSNLTDPDSSLMKKNSYSDYTQGYNCQAAVDADGTQLILGQRVSGNGNDSVQLTETVLSVSEEVGMPNTVLADSGYASGKEVGKMKQERGDTRLLISIGTDGHRRKHDFRPEGKKKRKQKPREPWRAIMSVKMKLDEFKEEYRKRQQTVEPVFGIVKQVLGFRNFHLRGQEKVGIEWCLVSLSYNFKRLFNMLKCAQAAG